MNEFGLIIGMMILTFGPRYIPFAFAGQFNPPRLVHKALEYVPIAALTVIVIQVSFYRDGALSLNFSNAYLVAAVVAFIVSLVSRKMFLTIIAGLLSYILCLWLNGFSVS